jgi:hypothetical protein
MGSASRTALLLLVSTSIIGWSGISFAYRPFDSTDAAVADVGQLEVELGPVEFRRANEQQTLIAPDYVLNFGFAKNWELVLEGRGEHPLPPAEDTRSRFVGDGLFFKGVLREGALQDKSGPSVAVEFGPLLPGLNDEQGWGASWPIRPVAEVDYDRVFNGTETFAVLAGAIRQVSDDLSFDFAVREAWINRQPVTEIRAGLTFAISSQKEAPQLSTRSLRR